MFIQVFEGKTSDPDALHRQLDVWERDLKPGAVGYLGSTGGCTSTGDCIVVVRFESRDAARRNSERPEQTAWWHDTERCFDGPVRFHDSEDVQVMTHGSLDDAGFVQAMEGHVADPQRAHDVEADADSILADERPDLLGSVTAFFDDGEFTELAYFTTEEAARAGERKDLSPEAAASYAQWSEVMPIDRYFNLTDPWLMTA
jgi:hypothetical protein